MGRWGRRKKQQRGRSEPRLFPSDREALKPTRRKRAASRRLGWFWLKILSTCLSLCLLGLSALAVGFVYVWMNLEHQGLLQIPARAPGLMVLASDGSVLAEKGAFFGDEAQLAQLPDYVPNALIAIEDRRFESHFGIDPMGLLRAMATNFKSGKILQGGSTLTQQLAKNLFLSPERTMSRKFQEMVLAVWLEHRFSKREILELYLNRVYYGAGAIGIEKAAQTYYRKSARELSLMEAATLAGLLKAPSTYNPLNRPREAEERATLVLDAMVNAGFISRQEANWAVSAPATVIAADYVPATQYIVDWIEEQLPDFIKDYSQSLIIETSIDPKLQHIAEKSLRNRLKQEGTKLHVSQGALVLMDVKGAIRALVGGVSYKASQYNRATKAKRQPGSAFKAFVYLTALEQGYQPQTVEIDEPIHIRGWAPDNYKHKYLGPVTLTQAFAQSINTIAAKLTVALGPQKIVATAHRLGILSPLSNDASIALGTSEVTLLELTSAFAPFANGGTPIVAFVVNRILTRDGTILYERHGDGLEPIVSRPIIGAMNKMMRAVISEGTARRAQFGDFDLGGKTGTSQENRDAWFIGYSPYFVAGIWVGNDDNSPTNNVTGGTIPVAIWRDVMELAHNQHNPIPLPGHDDAPRRKDTIANIDDLPLNSGIDKPEDQPAILVKRRKHRNIIDVLGDLFR